MRKTKNDNRRSRLKEDLFYCAYIDVLGYGNIVLDENKSTDRKIKILESIYKNLFASISFKIKEINDNSNDKIFIKSFSDSVYLESKNIEILLFALYNIFNIAFNYNYNLSHKEEYTPLLRAGIVKDWSLHFMDIASLIKHPIDKLYQNDELNNPVGLGIVRAYLLSEKSNLSGMRILISPEVIGDLKLKTYKITSFECYSFNCKNFIKLPWIDHNPETIPLFITPIRKNEKEQIINIFEICWPVFKYAHTKNETDILHHIREIIRMRRNFKEDNIRHYIKTLKIIIKASLITLSMNISEQTVKIIKECIMELKKRLKNI